MADRENTGSLVAAFLLGALLGAGVALLTAPRSGKETREELRQWAEGATAKAREKVKELYASARDRLSRHGETEPERT